MCPAPGRPGSGRRPSLRFQPDSGSQNSTRMSESLLGVSAAVMRQNAGPPAKGFVAAPAASPLAQ